MSDTSLVASRTEEQSAPLRRGLLKHSSGPLRRSETRFIEDAKARRALWCTRTEGLLRKGFVLSVLTGCSVSIVIEQRAGDGSALLWSSKEIGESLERAQRLLASNGGACKRGPADSSTLAKRLKTGEGPATVVTNEDINSGRNKIALEPEPVSKDIDLAFWASCPWPEPARTDFSASPLWRIVR